MNEHLSRTALAVPSGIAAAAVGGAAAAGLMLLTGAASVRIAGVAEPGGFQALRWSVLAVGCAGVGMAAAIGVFAAWHGGAVGRMTRRSPFAPLWGSLTAVVIGCAGGPIGVVIAGVIGRALGVGIDGGTPAWLAALPAIGVASWHAAFWAADAGAAQ
jgi:hypothetical protein